MAPGDMSPSVNTRPSFPLPSPDSGRRGPASPLARHAHHQRQATASSSQTAIFRTAAPPLIFAVLVAGLLVELRMRLAPPPVVPEVLLPGVTVRGNTVAQSALMWAEARWPGMWALPVLCAGALAALRVVIWAGAAVADGFEERGSDDVGVRVGRWEDGGSVSGGDLLTGVFT